MVTRYAGNAGGSANALTLTLNPALTAHTSGLPITFAATAANTGAATVNINGLGAVAVKRLDGSALRVGDIVAGQRCEIVYTGAVYLLSSAVREATTLGGLISSSSGAASSVVATDENGMVTIGTNSGSNSNALLVFQGKNVSNNHGYYVGYYSPSDSFNIASLANGISIPFLSITPVGVLVNGAPATAKLSIKSPSSSAYIMHLINSAGSQCVMAREGASGTSQGWAGVDTVLYIGKDNVTGRSISEGGTINSAGADYAEYETKSAWCGEIAKGQILGFDTNGNITDKWAEAISFGVKSTNPNLVGGDTWGIVDAVGSRPEQPIYQRPVYSGAPDPGLEPDSFTIQHDAWQIAMELFDSGMTDYESTVTLAEIAYVTAMEQYQAALSDFETQLEAARQRVDRVAYSGKCPVNVTGATVGDYIIATQDGAGIKGGSVSDPTFDQYRRSVGRVRRILEDGRAEIAVIVH